MTMRYAIGDLNVTMAYAVGEYYNPIPKIDSPELTTNTTGYITYNLNQTLLEKKLKLYENIIEYLVSLLSQEDREAVKELSELLSRLSHKE